MPTSYNGIELDSQLTLMTKRAFELDRILEIEEGKLSVVELFKWYSGDFQRELETKNIYVEEISEIVNEYVKLYKQIETRNYPVLIEDDYDWSLNKL